MHPACPKKDKVDSLNKEFFLHLFQGLALDRRGYGENNKEENVLSQWKYSCEAGGSPFLQEKIISFATS